jgi:hypothetical protein
VPVPLLYADFKGQDGFLFLFYVRSKNHKVVKDKAIPVTGRGDP